jgi:polysaccharide biosynthesis protein PslG
VRRLLSAMLTTGLAITAALTVAPIGAAHARTAGGSAVATKRYVGGVAVGDLQPWNSRRAADFAAVAAANSSWIRSDLGWKYLEPTRGSWQWPLFDQVVKDATANGMRYLGILHTVPDWANGGAGDYAPPADLSLLTNYCYLTAKHYLPLGVREFEIGNEVNLPHAGVLHDGVSYARTFLRPCVAGVRKAAAERGVRATILFGSLAPTVWSGGTDPVRFLTEAYANGAAGQFDALAWHPYTGADWPATSPYMNSVPTTLAKIMADRGDRAKKIWATEFGQATGGAYPMSEQDQAKLVTAALTTWYAQPFAGPLFWYSARDLGTSTTDREHHFGVLRNDGTQKPSYPVLRSLLVR